MKQVDTVAQQRHRNVILFGWILALYSTVSSSIIPALVRGLIVEGISPSLLLLLRLGIAIICLALTIVMVDWRKLVLGWQGIARVSLVGIISGVEICFFFLSLAYIDASMVSMLKSTQPLMVLLLLRIGGEKLRVRHLVRVGLALVGVYFLVGPGGQVSAIGLMLVGGSILLYAAQLVFVQWFLADYDSLAVTTYLLGWMTMVSLVWWWLDGAVWQQPSSHGWLIIIILAIFTTYLARLAIYAAVSRIGSGQVSLLWPLQMFLAVVFAVLFLEEYLTKLQWGGGFLILLSTLLAIERFCSFWSIQRGT